MKTQHNVRRHLPAHAREYWLTILNEMIEDAADAIADKLGDSQLDVASTITLNLNVEINE